MQVQPYLFFDGRCEEALDFYKKALGAKVEMMMRYKESPEPPPPAARVARRRRGRSPPPPYSWSSSRERGSPPPMPADPRSGSASLCRSSRRSRPPDPGGCGTKGLSIRDGVDRCLDGGPIELFSFDAHTASVPTPYASTVAPWTTAPRRQWRMRHAPESEARIYPHFFHGGASCRQLFWSVVRGRVCAR